MIEFVQGNLLNADVQALVNTVNCIGYMGRGIALQFKQAFPENFQAYHKACKDHAVVPGKIFVYHNRLLTNPEFILNFPTKRHWRSPSRLEDIEAGLHDLVRVIQQYQIHSLAMPALGCGLGGLEWDDVRPLIEDALGSLPHVQVLVYPPAAAPVAKARRVSSQEPKLTRARAQLIGLMGKYKQLAYELSQLEIQKLAYFLQESGEPLRLPYKKYLYGPYADNLNQVLATLEGHFIHGYDGQRKPTKEIQLLPHSLQAAQEWLRHESPDAYLRVQRVSELIEGFETPYGMELLASVHWLATHEDTPSKNAQEAIEAMSAWNVRKKRVFASDHVVMAWDHLEQRGWLG